MVEIHWIQGPQLPLQITTVPLARYKKNALIILESNSGHCHESLQA